MLLSWEGVEVVVDPWAGSYLGSYLWPMGPTIVAAHTSQLLGPQLAPCLNRARQLWHADAQHVQHFSNALLVHGTVPAPNQMTIPPEGSLKSLDVVSHPLPPDAGILAPHGVGMVVPLAMVSPPVPAAGGSTCRVGTSPMALLLPGLLVLPPLSVLPASVLLPSVCLV